MRFPVVVLVLFFFFVGFYCLFKVTITAKQLSSMKNTAL